MKSLSLEQMEDVQGGGWANAFCNAAGAASIGTGILIQLGAASSMGPFGWGIMVGIDIACLAYGW